MREKFLEEIEKLVGKDKFDPAMSPIIEGAYARFREFVAAEETAGRTPDQPGFLGTDRLMRALSASADMSAAMQKFSGEDDTTPRGSFFDFESIL